MRSDPRFPLCMSIGDADLWWQADALIRGERTHAVSPCDDCCRPFAEMKRAEQSCDGHYPGERGPAPVPTRPWGYVTEEERLEARRRTWRDSSRRKALRQASA